MTWPLLGSAIGTFAITNIDDLLVLAVFFGRVGRWAPVALGQYLGFAGILAVSVLGALGVGLLPSSVIPYLGLLPLALGLHAAWQLFRSRDSDEPPDSAGVLQIAAVTFANGGDNIGVYVPVFAAAGFGGMVGYVAVFVAGVALLCGAGWFLASRRPVARALARWGHVLLPVVLIVIGLAILFGG
ncbi:cadmium resistance transporter [Kutzneria sp. NPDC052558]|uniref:cadmium resistance transporter n=1 Tax=Kutzneria sp. NPDC052558 TaxID=3364121 RepID=UPI0037C845E8